MVAVYFGAQLIKGGGGDAGHDGPNLHKLSNLAQLRLALPEPARELPGTTLSGWKRAGRLRRRVLQARTPVADPRFGRLTSCAGINRHVVGDARAPQERRKRLHPDL